jgi:hypothetical protein
VLLELQSAATNEHSRIIETRQRADAHILCEAVFNNSIQNLLKEFYIISNIYSKAFRIW